MKKVILLSIISAGIIFACTQEKSAAEKEELSNVIPPNFKNQFCDSATNGGLCSYLPLEVHVPIVEGYDSNLDSMRQPPFDVFSWQTFIALNWPADKAGNPVGNSISDNKYNPRVWEYYRDPVQVFSSSNGELLLQINNTAASGEKVLHKSSKAPGKLNTMKGFEEADGHPLIDRNLNFALYEIRMNKVEDTFITNNKLYLIDSIGTYYLRHSNSFALPPSDSATKKMGMVEIKAAWRILDPAKGDDTSRFYCRNATVIIDGNHTTSGKPLKFRSKVGLVGLHIFRTTSTFGQGIWSTFEHIDNTPPSPQHAQNNQSTQWSFYNPKCLNCPINEPPALMNGEKNYKWDTVPPYAARYATRAPSQPTLGLFGTQVVREFPIYGYTEYINRLWQNKLKGTVWANYKLIGSQWQFAETFPPPNAPALLANSVQETFIQQEASCINCHQSASVGYVQKPGDTVNISTGLSFLFPVYAR